MGYQAGPPPNDRIDYARAGRIEAAVRTVAQENSFSVINVRVRSNGHDAPTIEIELRQQPGVPDLLTPAEAKPIDLTRPVDASKRPKGFA